MTKQEIIAAFCGLTTEVAGVVFNHNYSSDCFCHEEKTYIGQFGSFSFSKKVFDFINEAVQTALIEKRSNS